MRACDVRHAEERTDGEGPTAQGARQAGPTCTGQGQLSWLWGPSSWPLQPGSSTRSQGGVWAQLPGLRHPRKGRKSRQSRPPGLRHPRKGRKSRQSRPPGLRPPRKGRKSRQSRPPGLRHPRKGRKSRQSQPPGQSPHRAGCCWMSGPEAGSPAPGPARGPPTQPPGGASPGDPEPRQRPPQDGPQRATRPLQSRGPGRAERDGTTRQTGAPSGTGLSSGHAAPHKEGRMRGESELLLLGVRLQPPGRLSANFRSRPGAGRSRVGGSGG